MSEHRLRKKVNGIRIALRVKNNLHVDYHRICPKLSIIAHTGMTEEQLRKQFKEFIKDCPNATLQKNMFMNMLMNILNEATMKTLTSLWWRKDWNNKLHQLYLGYSVPCWLFVREQLTTRLPAVWYTQVRQDSVERAGWVVWHPLHINEGVDKKLALRRSYQIFETFDTTNNDYVTREEFIQACLQDKDLVNNLK